MLLGTTVHPSGLNNLQEVTIRADAERSRTSTVLGNAQKALQGISQTEIVDASFKVIGEHFVMPSSFVHLLVKLWVVPLGKDGKAASVSKETKGTEKRAHEFFLSKKESSGKTPLYN